MYTAIKDLKCASPHTFLPLKHIVSVKGTCYEFVRKGYQYRASTARDVVVLSTTRKHLAGSNGLVQHWGAMRKATCAAFLLSVCY